MPALADSIVVVRPLLTAPLALFMLLVTASIGKIRANHTEGTTHCFDDVPMLIVDLHIVSRQLFGWGEAMIKDNVVSMVNALICASCLPSNRQVVELRRASVSKD